MTSFYLDFFFFLMWIILGVFIEFVTTLLPFYVLFFWLMPVPQPEIKLAPPQWKAKS